MHGVVVLQAAFFRRGIQAALYFLVAVPHVADRDRLDALSFTLEPVDDLDVRLAAAADAEEGDADPLVGAEDAAGSQQSRTRR